MGIFLLVAGGCASAAEQGGRVILLVAGNISIRDLTENRCPHIERLIAIGASGLMNVRAGRVSRLMEIGRRPGMEAGCLAIGSGAMASGGAEVRRAGNADQIVGSTTAGRLWSYRMGRRSVPSEVVHTEIAAIWHINQSATYRASPGLLGSTLRAKGIRTAVIGSSGIPGEVHAEAAAIAMDSNGLVDMGNVDPEKVVRRDVDASYGVCTNLDAVARELDRVWSRCRFVVVDAGDTYRADRYSEYCTNARAVIIRRLAIERLDRLVGRIVRKMDFEKDTMILLSPSSRTFTDIQNERLTPIIICGPGFGGGVLVSPSTRRPGIVTIADVAPTVLAAFGLRAPAEMTGRAISVVKHTGSVEFVSSLNLWASLQGQRQVIMRGAAVAQSAIVVLVTMGAIFGSARGMPKAGWWALVPVALVIGMLHAPGVYAGGLVGTLVCVILLAAAVAVVFGILFQSALRAFVWMCGAFVVSVLIDLARGGQLVCSSVAGYGLLEGARYYGLGNELMGSLIGATMMAVAGAVRNSRMGPLKGALSICPILGVVFVFIGWPTLGANMGGALSMAVAIAATCFVLSGRKLSPTGVLVILVVGLLGAVSVVAVDALRASAYQSHIGRLGGVTASGRLVAALVLAQRKFALNIMLLSTSVWSRLLLTSVVGSVLMWFLARWKSGAQCSVLGRCENALLTGCAFGTAGAFAFNDSGVLASAACAVILWSYLVLRYCELRARQDCKLVSESV
ncbi:MAG: hypothetical protein ACUVRS_09925 [Armatimonadota bacterium]